MASDPTDSRSTADPQTRTALLRMVFGYMASQAIHAAARPGVADVLRDSAKTSEELAAALFASAGFELSLVTPPLGTTNYRVIEGMPV